MIWILMPVHNEETAILKTMRDYLCWCKEKLQDHFQIVIINDHSTDSTVKNIKTSRFDSIKLINNFYPKGKGSALKYAYLHLREEIKSDDLIVFIDGDGQIDIEVIEVFMNLMFLYKSDVVVGNKYHQYSQTRYTFARRIVSYLYNLLVFTLFRLPFKDTQCGIKMFKKAPLDSVIGGIITRKFAFDVELLTKIRGMGFRIVDGPVKIKKQLNQGSVNIISMYETFQDTIKIFLKLVAK